MLDSFHPASTLFIIATCVGCTNVAGLDELQFSSGGGNGGVGGSGGVSQGGGGQNQGGSADGGTGGDDTSHLGDVLWGHHYGDELEDYVSVFDIAADDAIVIAGSFDGTIDFGGQPLVNVDLRDAFIAILEANGTLREARAYGGVDHQSFSGLKVMADGAYAVCATFRDTLELPSTPVASADSWDAAVAVLEDLDSVRWAAGHGAASGQDCHDVDSTAASVIAKGALDGASSFGGDSFDSLGSTDGWMGGYDVGSGAHGFSFSFGDAAPTTRRPLDRGEIAVTPEGAILMVGQFDNTVNFGGSTLASVGDIDAFVARVDASGAHVFSRSLGGLGDQDARNVAFDGEDAVVVGAFENAMDVGTQILMSEGARDAFVMKIGADGVTQWARAFGGISPDEARAVAVDAWGNIFVAGTFEGAIDFGRGALEGAGGEDVFIVKLDPMGDVLWSKRFGGPGDQVPRHCEADSVGSVVCGGQFDGTMTIGGRAFTSLGDDIWLLKLSP